MYKLNIVPTINIFVKSLNRIQVYILHSFYLSLTQSVPKSKYGPVYVKKSLQSTVTWEEMLPHKGLSECCQFSDSEEGISGQHLSQDLSQ